MKFAILTAAIMTAIFVSVDPVAAQTDNDTIGINVIPATARNDRTETLVITYTELENRFVYLYETVPPATTDAECVGATDLTNLVAIPPERTAQIWGEGKKVVIVMTKTSQLGSCHVIVGRSGPTAQSFTLWRSNFGRTLARSDADTTKETASRPTRAPIHKIGRRFPN